MRPPVEGAEIECQHAGYKKRKTAVEPPVVSERKQYSCHIGRLHLVPRSLPLVAEWNLYAVRRCRTSRAPRLHVWRVCARGSETAALTCPFLRRPAPRAA